MKLVPLALTLMLAGCAGTPAYVSPPAAGNARVTLDAPGASVVVLMDGENCADPRVFEPQDNPSLRADKTFTVEARRKVALYTQWIAGLSVCKVMLTATLQPDRHYLLTGQLGGQQCGVALRNGDGTPLGPQDGQAAQVDFGFMGGCKAK